MEKSITLDQIKSIYSLAGSMGLVAHGQHDDNLHLLVEGITGKDRVSSLTTDEAHKVIGELRHRQRFSGGRPRGRSKPKTHPEKPGGISAGQQKKIWALMYQLAEYDPGSASVGDRLVGAIQEQFQIMATPKDPFRWLNHADANRLIERLNGYVRSAKRKADRESDTG